jgi:chaperonin GroES
MNIKPLQDRILLKAIEKENITSSGIYIPEWANKERPYIYEVIAVWPGKEWKEISVKVWDRVLSWQYSGDDVKVNWQEFKIVGIDYILAIVEN